MIRNFMVLRLAFLRIFVAAAALLAVSPLCAQSQRQALQTQIAARGVQPLGRAPGSQQLRLAISLPLRNEEELNSFLEELHDPNSPNYRHYLSVQQFTERFSPALADYERVTAFAQSHGLQVTHTFANRLVVDVSGPVAAIEQAFQVRLYVYQHPTENRTFFAPDVEPTVDAGVPVLSVDGMSNFNLPHPMLKRAQPNTGVHSDQTGSGPGGQFLGSDMRAAYGGGTALDGTGQVVGLIELGPYRLADVLSYFSSLNQPLNVPITNVLVGVNGVCGVGCDDGEEAIDIQQAIAMAPNLSALIVYETNGASTDALSAYAQAASDNIAKQLSLSFGWGGTPSSEPGYEQVFMELAAQGVSSFVASGDAGASLSGGYPGNSPNITDAGGTDLTTASAGGVWQSETGWIGSGGGWNSASPIPSYQLPVINSTNGGDPSFRNIPDVAAEANTDNYFCANGSCQGGIGGTSLAAPRWAAFVALINQQAAANATSSGSNTPVGFINTMAYTVGQNSSYGNVFHDINSGTNENGTSCTPGTLGCLPDGQQGFDAAASFDLVTGWGSPNGPAIFNALAPVSSNANFTMASSPSALSLTPGGSKTSSISLSALNGFSASTNLSVVIPGSGSPSYAPVGLTATLSSSTIPAGGGPVTLTVNTTSSTPGGTYVVAVVGTSGSLTQAAYVTVELPAFVGLSASPSSGLSVRQGGTTSTTISATVINGFNSTVTFSATGLPSGVTASFNPVNATTTTVTFTAGATAALTGASQPAAVVITGAASGSSPQSTGISLFVNPAASGGSGTAVDLSSALNVYAFYEDVNDSDITATNSLDGVGYAYSANLLGAGLDFKGTQFSFGPANQANAVSGNGGSISLPAGIYTSLELIATGLEGNQSSQTVKVTYGDSTSTSFTQSFSDWCSALNGSGCVSTGGNPGESVAVAMPYRDSAGGPDNRVFYVYHYAFALNTNKTVQSLTLPNNRNVVVLAATLSGPVSTGFTLAPTSGSVNVPQSGGNTSTINVTETGGFTGAVALSASGLPSGVTASFNPTTTSTSSTLTLTADATAPIGSTVITITGTSGAVTETATLTVNVTSPASYSLSAGNPSQGTISPGGSSQSTLSVASANGYTGTVTLSCSIAPVVTPAPTCSFGSTSPVTVSGSDGSATLTFNTIGPSAAWVSSYVIFATVLPVPAFLLIGVGTGSRNRLRRKLFSMLLLWFFVATLIVAPACGGGTSNGGGGGGNNGTPAGTYTVTITGKDATGTSQTNTAPTVTITVN